jgi:hypothetical protein
MRRLLHVAAQHPGPAARACLPAVRLLLIHG